MSTLTAHGPASLYARAAAHYLSPGRRDPVKRLWEEPFSQGVLADVVARPPLVRRQNLRVLDIGSGTGDGLALLEQARAQHDRNVASARSINYLGVDVDPEMVETSQRLHDRSAGVAFRCADVRDGVPPDPFDIYMSCGVPYSHLTAAELSRVLTDIFSTILRNATTSTVIVDVLGRYSIEWMPKWESSRWLYSMNFFEDTNDMIQAPMTFHSKQSLSACIANAAQRSGIGPLGVEYHDRSIMVGRHTATRAYNEAIPPLRTLVNGLYEGSANVELTDLLLDFDNIPGPRPVSRFYRKFAGAWNRCVREAIDETAQLGDDADFHRMSLADSLCRIEYDMQRGLGVGHSLIAVVRADGRARPRR